VSGLEDAARPGRPISITALERHQVIAAATRLPSDFGVTRNTWTHESLAEALMSAELVREISASHVGRILDEADIKPHRVKMWCHSTDPAFQEKMRAIVRLYGRRRKGEPVLCIDEKTGMQALSRSRELHRPAPVGRRDSSSNTSGTARGACSRASTWHPVGFWDAVPPVGRARSSSRSWTW
jgi:hypothetical protein